MSRPNPALGYNTEYSPQSHKLTSTHQSNLHIMQSRQQCYTTPCEFHDRYGLYSGNCIESHPRAASDVVPRHSSLRGRGDPTQGNVGTQEHDRLDDDSLWLADRVSLKFLRAKNAPAPTVPTNSIPTTLHTAIKPVLADFFAAIPSSTRCSRSSFTVLRQSQS